MKLEVTEDVIWKAIGGVVLFIFGFVQMLFWRWLKLEKKCTEQHIQKSGTHIEQRIARQIDEAVGKVESKVHTVEAEFREHKEIFVTRLNVIEKLREEDQKQFTAMNDKLETMRKEHREDNKTLADGINSLKDAILAHIGESKNDYNNQHRRPRSRKLPDVENAAQN